MKNLIASRCALYVGCVAIAACSQAMEPPISQYAPNANAVTGSGVTPLSYGVLYNFTGLPGDGAGPSADLIVVGDKLYGTTKIGGVQNCGNSAGCGTAFSITTGGTEKVLHDFCCRPDGFFPEAGLIEVGGTFYGTTVYGGTPCRASGGCGTVFSITARGAEKVLHSFGKGSDGRYPVASLTDVNGTLYGTTVDGGTQCPKAGGCGTVFSITTGGTEKVLHSFSSGTVDGAFPYASLTNLGGVLYGTTSRGGRYNSRGTVFSITTGGAEKVLHSFGNGSDGRYPEASLTNVGGTLYGTTVDGGTKCPKVGGCGTVFSITTGGMEDVLHSFSSGAVDGAFPYASLTNLSGILYGTTTEGGRYHSRGTVFSIDLRASGRESILHDFGDGNDGIDPYAGVIYDGGKLAGTTYAGGRYNQGTIFSLSPDAAHGADPPLPILQRKEQSR